MGRSPRSMMWVVRAVVCLAACAGLIAGCAPARPSHGHSREYRAVFAPDPVRQRLIDPQPASQGLSWLGGDVATSAPVAERRWIWLFGDTLLGTVSDHCASGVTYCDRSIDDDPFRAMIPNSVGVMVRNEDGSFSPLAKFWRLEDGQPAPIFAAANPGEFLWPIAAVHVQRHLIVAANRHTRKRGLFALGNVVLRVDNPEASPDAWTYSRHPLPNVFDETTDSGPLTWSTALTVVADFLYVFGERGVGFEARTVLCRLALDDIATPDWEPAPEYLLQSANGLTWSARFDLGRLHALEGLPGTSEATIAFDDRFGWYTFQIPPLAFEIRLYTARDPIGPWRDRGVVYAIPPPWSPRPGCAGPQGCDVSGYAAYAVKAHPELAPAGGQVLSYNVNLDGTGQHTAELAIERVHGFYVPQIISRGPLFQPG